jgi:lysozyme family protein
MDVDLAHRLRNDLTVAVTHATLPSHHDEYLAVERDTHVPWFFVAAVHHMECGGRLDQHLHNGDPLTARTVHVPAGRPKIGTPPFTWRDSAGDALRMRGLDAWRNWGVSGLLFQLEAYNGFGYRSRGINAPYLWSGSNLYAAGKYVADSHFDPAATSKQVGAAVILKWLELKKVITL